MLGQPEPQQAMRSQPAALNQPVTRFVTPVAVPADGMAVYDFAADRRQPTPRRGAQSDLIWRLNR